MSLVSEFTSRKVRVHALSHVGEVRTRNEDAIGLSCADGPVTAWTGELPADGGWALLTDGMGGHVAGEVASTIAIEVMRPLAAGLNSEADIGRAVSEADRGLYLAMQLRPELAGMGTTLTGVVLRGRHAFAFNVGDSRAYLYSDGELDQLSVDHAIEGQLTQCLGGFHGPVPLSPHVARVKLPRRGVLFLCSDGVTDMLDDDAIAHLLSSRPSNPATTLVRAALEAGGYDNATVVALTIEAPERTG